MKIHRAGLGGVAVVGVGLLALVFSQAAQAQVKLEYKFPEGKKLTYKTTAKMQQILTINGTEIPTTVDSTTVSSQTIGKRRGDSTLPIEQKNESLRVELTTFRGINLTFDSKEPDAKIENEQVAFLGDVFKLAGETVYTVVLDGQNKVKALEGLEKVQEKADKLDAKAKDLSAASSIPTSSRRTSSSPTGNLPDVLARPGESWERTEDAEVGGGQTLTFRKKYEYAGTEKKGDKTLDKITSKAIEVKYTMDPASESPLKVTKSDLKIESSEGTICSTARRVASSSPRGRPRSRGA